jgi:CDGSH-type Zn-finger protein
VKVRENGPLLCKGNVRVLSADGAVLAESDDLVLCRCGASANKPFCDGSHREAGFQDAASVADEKPETLEEEGVLEITCRTDGMLVAKGPVTIIGAGGGETTRNKAALCRCGHSARKPFCDISHKKCGFSAP